MLLLYIGLGGALGAVARFATAGTLYRLLGERFPWGTLGVNIFGSLALGLLLARIDTTPLAARIQAFLIIGFLGDFTTFSTFSADVLALLRQWTRKRAVFYVAASVLGCVGAVAMGFVLGRLLREA